MQSINLFYTVVLTIDNKRITVPNGNLMNANVTNYTAEDKRRVDLVFSCAKSEKPAEIQQCILDAVAGSKYALAEPAPFARLSGGTNEAMEFTVRVWCKTEEYWDLYFELNQLIVEAFGEKGVKAPALRVLNEKFCGSIRKKQLWIAATANKLKARIRTGKTVPSFLISDPSHTGGPMNRRSL